MSLNSYEYDLLRYCRLSFSRYFTENRANIYIFGHNDVNVIFFKPIFPVRKLIEDIIIWQDSLEVNPSVLIGSFLVGILPYGPFPWKRSYAVYFFGFRKPRRQIQTIGAKSTYE